MVVHGGYANSEFDDTWAYTPADTASQWSKLAPRGGTTPPMSNHALVFDPRRNRSLAFGAWRFDLPLEVWEFGAGGASAWRQLAPSGLTPEARPACRPSGRGARPACSCCAVGRRTLHRTEPGSTRSTVKVPGHRSRLRVCLRFRGATRALCTIASPIASCSSAEDRGRAIPWRISGSSPSPACPRGAHSRPPGAPRHGPIGPCGAARRNEGSHDRVRGSGQARTAGGHPRAASLGSTNLGHDLADRRVSRWPDPSGGAARPGARSSAGHGHRSGPTRSRHRVVEPRPRGRPLVARDFGGSRPGRKRPVRGCLRSPVREDPPPWRRQRFLLPSRPVRMASTKNSPPVAQIRAAGETQAGVTVVFDGSRSHDAGCGALDLRVALSRRQLDRGTDRTTHLRRRRARAVRSSWFGISRRGGSHTTRDPAHRGAGAGAGLAPRQRSDDPAAVAAAVDLHPLRAGGGQLHPLGHSPVESSARTSRDGPLHRRGSRHPTATTRHGPRWRDRCRSVLRRRGPAGPARGGRGPGDGPHGTLRRVGRRSIVHHAD